MNEFDDIFDPKPEDKDDLFNTDNRSKDRFANDLYRQSDEDKRNAFLFLIYIFVSLIITFVGGFMMNSQYAYLKDAIENVEETTLLEFTVEDNINQDTNEIDITYPYLTNITSEFTNNYDKEIPVFSVVVTFYDITNERIGTRVFTKENFLPGETFSLDEQIVSSHEPIDIEYSIEVDAPSMVYTLISLAQVTTLALLFFVVDKISFKRDWEDFKAKRKERVSNIFTGFLIVYASLIVANIILMTLGTTETSQNEMLIQSMFSDSPLNLFLLFMLLCVLTPIVEEVIFRKVLYNFIEPRSNHIVAIILSGAIFGLMHVISFGDFVQAIPYVLMGLAFGFIYWKSNKNIYVVIGVHFLNNFLSWLLYVLAIYGIYG